MVPFSWYRYHSTTEEVGGQEIDLTCQWKKNHPCVLTSKQ